MNRRQLITIAFLVGGAILVYVGYRWWQAKQAGTSPTGSFGTNLNSVAPELVGGSQGPSVGPAFNMPLNVTFTESKSHTSEMPDHAMLGVNAATGLPMTDTATNAPAGAMPEMGNPEETAADNSSTYGSGSPTIDLPPTDITVRGREPERRSPRRRRRREDED